jgi:hypothetical protein
MKQADGLQPGNIGAPESYSMIFFFGQTQAVRIDTESIAEIIEEPQDNVTTV